MTAKPRDPMRLAKMEARDIRRAAADAPDELRRHIKQCARCTLVADNWYRRCDVGWELTKLATRAVNVKANMDAEPPADIMDPLF